MNIREAITDTLRGETRPLTGRTVAERAGLPYKVTIDALDRMHDAGTVARSGRKFSARWLLIAPPDTAALALLELEAAWHRRPAPAPTPGGGGRSAPHPPA